MEPNSLEGKSMPNIQSPAILQKSISVYEWKNNFTFFKIVFESQEIPGMMIFYPRYQIRKCPHHNCLLDSRFELIGWYQSEHYYGIIEMEPMWSISTGIEKKFLSERVSVKVLVNDVYYKSSFRGRTNYLNQDFEINSADDPLFVRIVASYRFGKTTVKQARRRTTGAEEERGRINKD